MQSRFLVAVSRADLTENSVDQASICLVHLIYRKSTSHFEELHPDWFTNSEPWSLKN